MVLDYMFDNGMGLLGDAYHYTFETEARFK